MWKESVNELLVRIVFKYFVKMRLKGMALSIWKGQEAWNVFRLLGSKERLHFEHVRGLESNRYYSRGKSRSSSNRGTASGVRPSFFVITDDSVNRTLSVHTRLQIHAREVSKTATAGCRSTKKISFRAIKEYLGKFANRSSEFAFDRELWMVVDNLELFSSREEIYSFDSYVIYVYTYIYISLRVIYFSVEECLFFYLCTEKYFYAKNNFYVFILCKYVQVFILNFFM